MEKKNNETGFVLVACLMMLMVLTLVGLMATNTSIIELKVSANDKLAKTAFYRADSGIYTIPKLIRRTVEDGDPGTPTSITVDGMKLNDPVLLEEDPDDYDSDDEKTKMFYDRIYGFDANRTSSDFHLGTETVEVFIERTGTENLPGGSVEFASGYEGVGHGSTGGVAVLYTLDSTGIAPDQANGRDAVSTINALYKLIPGTAGGL